MNCYNHPSKISVGTCQDCKSGLCIDCAKTFDIPICVKCNTKRVKIEKNSIKKELLKIFIIGTIIGVILFQTSSANINWADKSKTLYILSCFYGGLAVLAGWQFLNKITPQFFLFMPIIGWFIYFIIKLFLSLFIGQFVFPFVLFMKVKRFIELKKIQT